MKITMDEWIKELQKACSQPQTDDGWMTSWEIREATGKGENYVGKMLYIGVRKGIIEVKKIPRPNIVGDVYPVPCYRLRRKK